MRERGSPRLLELSDRRTTSDRNVLTPAAHSRTAARQVVPDVGDVLPLPVTVRLGRAAYRMSEDSWEEAGRPEADVSIRARGGELVLDVEVRKASVIFRDSSAPDPDLDNEHPDIHSDGVQLYVHATGWDEPAAWLAVPERDTGGVRLRRVPGSRPGVPLRAEWQPTATGYRLQLRIPLDSLGSRLDLPVALDVLINDMDPGRERRRGQLVLSGGGGYVYLQGDRQSPLRFLRVHIPRG